MAHASVITSLVRNISLLLPANKERSQSELTRASESGNHDSNRESTKTVSICLLNFPVQLPLRAHLRFGPTVSVHGADEPFLSFLPVILPLHKPSGFLSFSLNLGNWTKPKEEKMTCLAPQQHFDEGSN